MLLLHDNKFSNGKVCRGRRVSIPSVFEYRESGKSLIKIKINEKELRGRPIVVLRWFIDLGFSRGWYRSGSHLLANLAAFGIRRCWDFPHLRKNLIEDDDDATKLPNR